MTTAELTPPSVKVPGDEDDTPVKVIDAQELKQLGDKLSVLFNQYVSDRRLAELRWTRNLRQYLGIYDPEVENQLGKRSRAYPRMTRVKSISTLSRIMNLMFPGNERNWEIKASPNVDMTVEDVKKAIAEAQARDQEAAGDGQQPPQMGDNGGPPLNDQQPPAQKLTTDYIMSAVKTLAAKRAADLSLLIDDQLEELGGDQTYDYVQLNRQVIRSGTIFGLGVLFGPYARKETVAEWSIDDMTQEPVVKSIEQYKPIYEFSPVWDYYPDMTGRNLKGGDGYFRRHVMSRRQFRALADREDFLGEQVKDYLSKNTVGNYKAQPFETELRAMSVKQNINEAKPETMKYEIISWHGSVSGSQLQLCGCDVDPEKVGDDIDAEIWMIGGNVIKAVINPWEDLGVDVSMVHTFIFDEDDASPVGQGLPNVMRDSQMMISNGTRMLMDNASVTCGPIIEMNLATMNRKQDLTTIEPYKVFYRDDDGPSAQWPAVREIKVDGHINELIEIVKLGMEFADAETFVGPATGGDMAKMPSEPMRTMGGASMMRGDAALPIKDIVRSFDSFTTSVLYSLVQFNRKLNPDKVPRGDFDVVARGATSLISKEVRGAQVDQLATTLTDEEKLYVDGKKLAKARFETRDMGDMLVSDEEAERRRKANMQAQQQAQDQAQQLSEANVRKLLSDAFKNVSQGQKNSALADAQSVETALELLKQGLEHAIGSGLGGQPGGNSGGASAVE